MNVVMFWCSTPPERGDIVALYTLVVLYSTCGVMVCSTTPEYLLHLNVARLWYSSPEHRDVMCSSPPECGDVLVLYSA